MIDDPLSRLTLARISRFRAIDRALAEVKRNEEAEKMKRNKDLDDALKHALLSSSRPFLHGGMMQTIACVLEKDGSMTPVIFTSSQMVEPADEAEKTMTAGVRITGALDYIKLMDIKMEISFVDDSKKMRLMDMRVKDVVEKGRPEELLIEVTRANESGEVIDAQWLDRVLNSWVARELDRKVDHETVGLIRRLISECMVHVEMIRTDAKAFLIRWEVLRELLYEHSQRNKRSSEAIASAHGSLLTMTVLGAIGENWVSRDRIAERVKMLKGNTQEILNVLERAGYIETRGDLYKRV